MRSDYRRLYRISVFATALVVVCMLQITACSFSGKKPNAYITRLRNRGIVPLSANNPYVAANALLAKEMETSTELKGFIGHRGTPSALQIRQDLFSPTIIELYYPENLEYYSLEENSETWVINGPLKLQQDKVQAINETTIFNSKEGKADLETSKSLELEPTATPAETKATPEKKKTPVTTDIPVAIIKTSTPTPEPLPTENILPKSTSTPEPIAIDVPAEVPSPTKRSAEPDTLGASKTNLVVLKEIVATHGRGFAEKTPKGDVVHYVSYPGETLAILARWYTYDIDNQQRLMRINRLEGKTLSLGDQVIIPRYLVQNDFLLTENALSAMQSAIADGSLR